MAGERREDGGRVTVRGTGGGGRGNGSQVKGRQGGGGACCGQRLVEETKYLINVNIPCKMLLSMQILKLFSLF